MPVIDIRLAKWQGAQWQDRGATAGSELTWRIRFWSASDKTWFSGTGRGFKAEPGADADGEFIAMSAMSVCGWVFGNNGQGGALEGKQ